MGLTRNQKIRRAIFQKEVKLATREILRARRQQQPDHQVAQPVNSNHRNSYSAARAIPYWPVHRRQSHHRYEDQQLIDGSLEEEEPNSYDDHHLHDDSNDRGDDSNGDFRNHQDDDFKNRPDDSGDQDDSTDQGNDSNDQGDDSDDSGERHQEHVDAERAGGGPPKMISRFWFEDANGKFVGGNNKRPINPDQVAPPYQVKRVRFSLANEDAAAVAGSSGINNNVEVSSFSNKILKQENLPRATPSDAANNQAELYRSINAIEMIEYRRRKAIVNHLTKICKAVPLTVKMVNPLKNFNGYTNNFESK